MNITQLQRASDLAYQYGVKSLIYGGPGTGKTPLIKTAPRPVMCVVEPGMLSMRDAIDIPAWEAYTVERIDEFFEWMLKSKEINNFDTIAIDSISQLAEIVLTTMQKKFKDGRQAYGEMAKKMMQIVNDLYYLQNKHIYIIAKQAMIDDNGVNLKRPYFPGQELNVKIPHVFDEIFHISETNIPGQNKPTLAIRTESTFGILARDRSGKLAELEQPHLEKIFKKCMLNLT